MYQRDGIKYSLYNYLILFLIYIGNMIKYLVSPRKKKIAKIHPILETKYVYVYDEEANYSNNDYSINCIIQFDNLTNKPMTCHYVKSYIHHPNTKSKID